MIHYLDELLIKKYEGIERTIYRKPIDIQSIAIHNAQTPFSCKVSTFKHSTKRSFTFNSTGQLDNDITTICSSQETVSIKKVR